GAIPLTERILGCKNKLTEAVEYLHLEFLRIAASLPAPSIVHAILVRGEGIGEPDIARIRAIRYTDHMFHIDGAAAQGGLQLHQHLTLRVEAYLRVELRGGPRTTEIPVDRQHCRISHKGESLRFLQAMGIRR